MCQSLGKLTERPVLLPGTWEVCTSLSPWKLGFFFWFALGKKKREQKCLASIEMEALRTRAWFARSPST